MRALRMICKHTRTYVGWDSLGRAHHSRHDGWGGTVRNPLGEECEGYGAGEWPEPRLLCRFGTFTSYWAADQDWLTDWLITTVVSLSLHLHVSPTPSAPPCIHLSCCTLPLFDGTTIAYYYWTTSVHRSDSPTRSGSGSGSCVLARCGSALQEHCAESSRRESHRVQPLWPHVCTHPCCTHGCYTL